MAPARIANPLKGFTGKEITNAQGNDHEEIPRKIVAVKKCPGDRGDLGFHVQVKNISMTAEEFEHPVERLCDADQHNDDNELMRGAMRIVHELPTKQKEEETEKSEPLEELDLSGKGEEGNC